MPFAYALLLVGLILFAPAFVCPHRRRLTLRPADRQGSEEHDPRTYRQLDEHGFRLPKSTLRIKLRAQV